jgi:hypothetical protein
MCSPFESPSEYCQNATSATFPGIASGDGTIDPNLLAIQQMRALEPIGWKGGEKHHDGTLSNLSFF